jgi:DNA primase
MGQTAWDGHRLSLGGVSSVALKSFLERNPNITEIQLCLDSDNAGRDAATRIVGELLANKQNFDKRIIVAPPPIGKDYADTAKAIQQIHMEKSKTINRPHEAVFHAERA